jgi:WD40 repeat protein
VARLANPEIAVSCLRWSSDGSRLAVSLGSWSSQDARLVVWDPAEGRIISEESLHRPIGALEWLAADTLLLADWEGGANLRSLSSDRSGLQIHLDKNLVSAARWSPDDRRLITAANQYLSGNAR